MWMSDEESCARLRAIQPLVLEGKLIRLEPLSEDHLEDLSKVGLDDAIWRMMVYGLMKSEADLLNWIKDLLARQSKGKDLPFAVIHLESGLAIGATRYMNIEPQHRSLEIGGTWYAKAYQGSGVNSETKHLLLGYAFEELGCIRVQLKTDVRNLQSQKAIERLGAVKEGVMRKHMILSDGTQRDSVYYSILDHEWPRVKQNLEKRINDLLQSVGDNRPDS